MSVHAPVLFNAQSTRTESAAGVSEERSGLGVLVFYRWKYGICPKSGCRTGHSPIVNLSLTPGPLEGTSGRRRIYACEWIPDNTLPPPTTPPHKWEVWPQGPSSPIHSLSFLPDKMRSGSLFPLSQGVDGCRKTSWALTCK